MVVGGLQLVRAAKPAATAANATARQGRDRPHPYPLAVIVAHLDLDAFFAAVEELEEPALKHVPLVVGGDPRGRGVVATANYVARSFGIHSAMSCAEAMRRCPAATFVRPRHSLYRDYSREVWATVREIVPTVEQPGSTRVTSTSRRSRRRSTTRGPWRKRCARL